MVVLVITSLRVPRHTNIKVIPVRSPDVLDEVLCVLEATRDGFPFFLLSGWVTAKLRWVLAATNSA